MRRGQRSGNAVKLVERRDGALQAQHGVRKAARQVLGGRGPGEPVQKRLGHRGLQVAVAVEELAPQGQELILGVTDLRGRQILGREQPAIGVDVVEPGSADDRARRRALVPKVTEHRGELGAASPDTLAAQGAPQGIGGPEVKSHAAFGPHRVREAAEETIATGRSSRARRLAIGMEAVGPFDEISAGAEARHVRSPDEVGGIEISLQAEAEVEGREAQEGLGEGDFAHPLDATSELDTEGDELSRERHTLAHLPCASVTPCRR
jgi:hypothetical protein